MTLPLTRGERRRVARGEPIDDEAVRVKRDARRRESRENGFYLGVIDVRLECGHEAKASKPQRKRPCDGCGGEQRLPVAVGKDGVWIDIAQWKAICSALK
jgi:hypothetical protein